MSRHHANSTTAFAAAWSAYPGTAPQILLLLLGWAGVWVVTEMLVFAYADGPGTPVWTILHIGYFYVTAFWEAALLSVAVGRFGGASSSIVEVLRDYGLAARLTAVKLLLLPLFLLGLLLAVIPGLYVLARLGLAPYILVEQSCGPLQAFRQCDELTRGCRPQLMMTYFLLVLFNAGGAALLGLGLLVTLPMTILIGGFILNGLRERQRSDGPDL